MKKLLTYTLAMALIGMVYACQRTADHSEKIQSIDLAIERVDSARQVFMTIDQNEGSRLNQAINGNVKRIATHYADDMDKETGMLLSQYKSTANIVKDWGSRYRRVYNEINRTEHQLSNLKKALEMNATQDSLGNAFTPEFVDRVFQQEMTVADHLVEEISDMKDRLQRAQESYETLHPRVQPLLDALPQNPQAE